jgi:hypothetical protein
MTEVFIITGKTRESYSTVSRIPKRIGNCRYSAKRTFPGLQRAFKIMFRIQTRIGITLSETAGSA